MTPRFAIKLNALAPILLGAFYFQIVQHELPCPLCLLQRAGFVALAFGPALMLRYGPRPSHYGLVLIAGLAGAGVAARQILLHIMPDDPGYGSAILGYHFYTRAFVCFVVAIAASAIMLLLDGQFDAGAAPELGLFERGAFWLIVVVALLNAGNALLECGLAFCAANPVTYGLITPAATP